MRNYKNWVILKMIPSLWNAQSVFGKARGEQELMFTPVLDYRQPICTDSLVNYCKAKRGLTSHSSFQVNLSWHTVEVFQIQRDAFSMNSICA